MTTEENIRGRDLGIMFEGLPGSFNSITDVKGVEVGHVTLISGNGELEIGKGPVRTGVTTIFPSGKNSAEGVAASWFSLNGAGEMTGIHPVEEYGTLFGPIALTNTLGVGTVRDAIIKWSMKHITEPTDLLYRSLPLVAETWDGNLNDIYGFHIKKEHVYEALDTSQSGLVDEGNVGGGTGMGAYGFKAGIGTSSRTVEMEAGCFTVGVLVQANHGSRYQLRITGIPVGKIISDSVPSQVQSSGEGSSIIIIIGTDTPLLPCQLKRLAKRASIGLARTGGIAENISGEIFLAFSTANRMTTKDPDINTYKFIRNEAINPLFEATIQAVEESIINSLVAAETMTGVNGMTLFKLPHKKLRDILDNYRCFSEKTVLK